MSYICSANRISIDQMKSVIIAAVKCLNIIKSTRVGGKHELISSIAFHSSGERGKMALSLLVISNIRRQGANGQVSNVCHKEK